MKNHKLPCINCITLPMCMSVMQSREPLVNNASAVVVVDLFSKCSLIKDYCITSDFPLFGGDQNLFERIDEIANYLSSKRKKVSHEQK